MRKENSSGGVSVGMKDENGEIVVDKEEVSKRWAGYFEGLLNVNDDRVATISVVGNGRECLGVKDVMRRLDVMKLVRIFGRKKK